jgi:MFS family permease
VLRALVDLSPLRVSGPYRRLWVSGVLGGVGHQVAVVAVLLQVWESTRNPFWVGAIGLAQAVPMIVLGLLGGPLADVLDRRVVALWSTTGQALVALALASQLLLGPAPLPVLLGLLSLQTACNAVGAPSRRTFVVRLLPREMVAAGVTLHMIAFQIGVLLGPALGGVLVAATSPPAGYLVNALTLVVSWWAVLRLPPMPPLRDPADPAEPREPTAAPPAGPQDRDTRATRVWRRTRRAAALLSEGVALVVRDRVLRGSFLLDLAAMLLSFPVALFPMINDQLFAGDPRTLGLFMSALAVGGATAGLVSGLVSRSDRLGRVQIIAVGVWGLAMLTLGLGALTGVAWVVLGALVVAGAADVASVTSRAATVQLATPDSHLGRVSAVEHVVGVAGPDLGNARAGLVAGLTTPAVAAALGGALCLAVTGWVALTHREVARFRVRRD